MLARLSNPAFCDCVYLVSDDNNLTIMLLMAVIATRTLLALKCTTIYQYLGEIGATSNESNGPESSRPSAGVTLTKFVYRPNPMRTRSAWTPALHRSESVIPSKITGGDDSQRFNLLLVLRCFNMTRFEGGKKSCVIRKGRGAAYRETAKV